jgi:metal-dependent amidase/aminoacylase/carboxypeptidase family protein
VHSHGSDGQSAILAGLASRLYENPVKQGRILLIFEPSSENGYGAQKLLRDKKFPALEITNCFSMQNIPGYPLGSIIIPGAAFSFASKGVIIKIKNNSTAQTDSQNSDFAVACGKIASNIPALCHDPLQNDFASISFIQMGSQNLLHNPQKAEIRFKLSSISDLRLEKLTEPALAYIHQVCLEYDLELFHSFTNIFPATSSDPELLEIIKHTALSLGLDVFENSIPLCIPEDFGNFNKTAPLAIFGIGSGINMPPLGSPHYDFPDDLIAPAIDFWMSLLKFLQVV